MCFSILVLYISQNFLTFLILFLNTFQAVNELTEKIDKAIIVREVKSNTTFKLQANSGGQYTADAGLFPTIEGYTRACVVGARANGDIGIVVYDNSWFYNTTSQEKSFTVTLTWLFVKNGLI